MMRLVKFSVIGVAVLAKLFLLLKFIHTMIKFKYLVIAAGYLALNGLKLWLYAKQVKENQKIYYTQSSHSSSYDEGDDDGWKRKIGHKGQDHDMYDISYSHHKPPPYSYVHQPDGIFE